MAEKGDFFPTVPEMTSQPKRRMQFQWTRLVLLKKWNVCRDEDLRHGYHAGTTVDQNGIKRNNVW